MNNKKVVTLQYLERLVKEQEIKEEQLKVENDLLYNLYNKSLIDKKNKIKKG